MVRSLACLSDNQSDAGLDVDDIAPEEDCRHVELDDDSSCSLASADSRDDSDITTPCVDLARPSTRLDEWAGPLPRFGSASEETMSRWGLPAASTRAQVGAGVVPSGGPESRASHRGAPIARSVGGRRPNPADLWYSACLQHNSSCGKCIDTAKQLRSAEPTFFRPGLATSAWRGPWRSRLAGQCGFC